MKRRMSFCAFVAIGLVLGCAMLFVAVASEAQTHNTPPSEKR